jgi:hypothetical protein
MLANVRRGERGFLNTGISVVQYFALRDLDKTLKRKERKFAASFTHTAMVVDEVRIGEMYEPHARFRSFLELIGREICFYRPLIENSWKLDKAVDVCKADVEDAIDYPFKELLYFYIKYFRKYATNEKFKSLFNDPDSHVCTPRCIHWLVEGTGTKMFAGEEYESFYPARLEIDSRFQAELFCKILP